MHRFAAVLIVCLPLLSACVAGKGRAKPASSRGDSTGVFVDACRNMMDSVTLTVDTLYTHETDFAMPFPMPVRSGDTVFYSGVVGFLRQPAAKGSWRYFFGYCHRCDRDDWDGAMWIEVVPKAAMASGKTYRKGVVPPGIFTCEESDGAGS